MSDISKENTCTYKNSRHVDRMTGRSDKCDCCVYEYINRKTGGVTLQCIGTDKNVYQVRQFYKNTK